MPRQVLITQRYIGALVRTVVADEEAGLMVLAFVLHIPQRPPGDKAAHALANNDVGLYNAAHRFFAHIYPADDFFEQQRIALNIISPYFPINVNDIILRVIK